MLRPLRFFQSYSKQAVMDKPASFIGIRVLLGVLTLMAAVALFIGSIWFLSATHTRHQVEAEYASAGNPSSASNQTRENCARLGSPVREECIAKAITTAREYERSESNLEAQRDTADWTGFMAVVAGLGLTVSILGVGLLYFTFKETREQSQDFVDSVGHASRSADAMEGVANAMSENTTLMRDTVVINKRIAETQERVVELQMRSYISVNVGSARFQERGMTFGAKPEIENSGQLPATNLRIRAKAGILPGPFPEGTTLDLVDAIGVTLGLIPHGQSRTVFAPVPKMVPEEQIPVVMRGGSLALYVWGEIIYDDELAKDRRTDFCINPVWVPRDDGKGFIIEGYFISSYNMAT